MKNLLIIGYLWPEPASSAAGSRMMQLISLFEEAGYHLIYASPAQKTPFAEDLSQRNIQTEVIQTNSKAFEKQLSDWKPAVVMFDRFMMEEQFGWRVAEQCPKALRILDTEDLHFFRKARYEAIKKGRNLQKSDLQSDEARREIASILRCDLSLIISEAERELLIEKFKVSEHLLWYLPFLMQPQTQISLNELPRFHERKDFMFMGNFLHEPNWDAVRYLKTEVWPEIRKKLPQANLKIYGAYTSHKVKQLHNKREGFLIEGRAENADEAFQNARVLLAPLRFGAGLKGKFLEAMKNGTPCVTTTIGAEGICGIYPWNGEIANDAQSLADAAIRLYQNQKRWEKSQSFGLQILNKRFQRADFAHRFWENLTHVSENLERHREQNFLGSMLMHHSLKSTKYMALWIETKNQLKALQKNG